MATIVDQAKKLAQHLGAAAREARRIRIAPQPKQLPGSRESSIDPIEFRRQGV